MDEGGRYRNRQEAGRRLAQELREKAYRGDRPAPDLEGRTAILVDDGVATGSSLRSAIGAARARDPERVVVAVPVSSPEAAATLREEADVFVCPLVPRLLWAIGAWYADFPQLADEQVREILERAWAEEEVRDEASAAREEVPGGAGDDR